MGVHKGEVVGALNDDGSNLRSRVLLAAGSFHHGSFPSRNIILLLEA